MSLKEDMSSTKEAFADAAAGVAGSLVAMLAFYPMEVLKTNRQAGIDTTVSKKKDVEIPNKSNLVDTVKWIQTLFRGLHYKTAHTIASSFVYFFISSWIQSKHKTLSEMAYTKKTRERGFINSGGLDKFQYKPPTSIRLLLTAVAAMLNVMITLPLDVLAAQSQTRSRSLPKAESNVMLDDGVQGNEGSGEQDNEGSGEHDDVFNLTREGTHNSIQEEKKEEGEPFCQKEVDPITNILVQQQKITPINTNKITDISKSIDSEIDTASLMESVWHDAAERSQEFKRQDSFLTSKEEEDEDDELIDSLHPTTSIENKNDTLPDSDVTESESNLKPKQTKPLFRIDTLTQPYPKQLLQSLSVESKKENPEPNKKEVQWKEYWRGIRPALLLCSNPSIHFTVFDVVKEWVFAQKLHRSKLHSLKDLKTPSHLTLTMMESFLLGMIAKFAATLATYPLIRAKVALMVSNRTNAKGENSSGDTSHSNNATTMMGLLKDMFRKGGVKELYKGCNLQLVHTLLKSALLMMVREKIQEITRLLLLGE